jgi:hypothetical protein
MHQHGSRTQRWPPTSWRQRSWNLVRPITIAGHPNQSSALMSLLAIGPHLTSATAWQPLTASSEAGLTPQLPPQYLLPLKPPIFFPLEFGNLLTPSLASATLDRPPLAFSARRAHLLPTQSHQHSNRPPPISNFDSKMSSPTEASSIDQKFNQLHVSPNLLTIPREVRDRILEFYCADLKPTLYLGVYVGYGAPDSLGKIRMADVYVENSIATRLPSTSLDLKVRIAFEASASS